MATVDVTRSTVRVRSGVRTIGTWRGRGTRTLVSVRRDQPAVRVDLTGRRWTGLLISVDDAPRVAAELATAE